MDRKGHSSNITEPVAAKIHRLRQQLLQIIDVDYGLLQELSALGVLDHWQIEVIRSKVTTDNKINELLNIIVSSSNAQQKKFLLALFNTSQTHVNNFILADGDLTTIDPAESEIWPLRFTSMFNVLNKNVSRLIDLIDTKLGLLEEMLSVGAWHYQTTQTSD
jgi:hypothetical protein